MHSHPWRIYVCSRAELPLIPIDAPYAAISIRDPGSPVPELPEPQLCRSVLRLEFDDAEPAEAEDDFDPDTLLMTERDAEAIVRFIAALPDDVRLLLVHCEAGFCRSPAVAAVLARRFGLDVQRYFRDYMPNMHVHRLLWRAFGWPAEG